MKNSSTGIFVGPINEVSLDARRSIKEGSDGKSFSVQMFEVFQSSLPPLGNHYHPAGKTETFILYEGGGEIVGYPVNENGEKTGEINEQVLKAPVVIHIPPYNVHTFYLDPGSKMVCVSSREFRPSDMCPAPVKL